MTRRQIAISLALRELGIELRGESFTDRLIVQKAVYLIQAFGLDLGYFYGWYLHGPYCSDVTTDLFGALADPGAMDDLKADWTLDNGTKRRLATLKALIHRQERPLARWLELLASVHFLIDRGQVKRKDHANGAKEVSARLKAFNKDFRPQEVRDGLTELESRGLLRSTRD
jgi:hypothetical protein